MQRRRFRFIPSKDPFLRNRSPLSRQRKDWGYALPLALILGVAMTVAALTMLARSRTNSLVTQSQRRSAESLSASEGGIDRTLAQLNRPGFSGLLLVDNDPGNLLPFDDPDNLPDPTIVWTPDAAGVAFGSGCSLVKGEIGGGAGGGGVTIDIDDILAGSAGTGSYEMLAYRFYPSKGQGVMMMEGTSGTSISRVMQTITVVEDNEDPDLSFPGLLGFNNINMGNNDVLGVDGNVICLNDASCPVTCFDTPATREAALRDAVNALTNSVIEGDIFVGDIEVPPVPAPPPFFSSPGSISITDTSTFPASTDAPVWVGPAPAGSCTVDPDPANCAYAYNVSSINVSGNKTVAIDFKQESNKAILPVIFHVSGNIDLAGSTTLNTRFTGELAGKTYTGELTNNIEVFPQANFRIYGNPKGGTTQTMAFSGNTCADAFIYAPTAKAGINGGGGGSPSGSCGIRGAVWVDNWGLSNSNAEAVIRVREGTALAIKSALRSDLFIGFGFAIAANRVEGIGGWARVDGEVRP
jgi:hypothetical protein